jgi:two-component system sensor histidine kinase ChvG
MASVTDTEKVERRATRAPPALRAPAAPPPAPPAKARAPAAEPPPAERRHRRPRRFTVLTQRILAINLLALGIVVGGVFYLDQYQRGLIEGRLEALATQGLIIASALGETVLPRDPAAPQHMDPDAAGELLQRLIAPLDTRARLFGNDGELVIDSLHLSNAPGTVEIHELPPPEVPGLFDPLLDAISEAIDRLLIGDLPHYVEQNYQRAEHYAEVVHALHGEIDAEARRDSDGEIVLNVAVPVRRFKAVQGALMLTAGTEDIQARVRSVRGDILRLCLLALAITVLLSLFLAGTIVRPIRQLAAGAERVAGGRGGPEELPDLSRRDDEVGDLSVALRTMTNALHLRIDAIARFAADVAHELKNPLSSLRSAVDTIARIDDPATRDRLLAVLTHDIERMDRLISDISAASKLDAELSRATMAPVDLAALLGALVSVYRDAAKAGAPRIVLEVETPGPIDVRGVEDRLAQVFRNLIDNAISFSPPGGTITVRLARRRDGAEVTVEDEGPGLPQGKTEAIFERFYSERPSGERFGTHSGLGLSISKQIVDAHHGTIAGENRPGPALGTSAGARFTVWLPY